MHQPARLRHERAAPTCEKLVARCRCWSTPSATGCRSQTAPSDMLLLLPLLLLKVSLCDRWSQWMDDAGLRGECNTTKVGWAAVRGADAGSWPTCSAAPAELSASMVGHAPQLDMPSLEGSEAPSSGGGGGGSGKEGRWRKLPLVGLLRSLGASWRHCGRSDCSPTAQAAPSSARARVVQAECSEAGGRRLGAVTK